MRRLGRPQLQCHLQLEARNQCHSHLLPFNDSVRASGCCGPSNGNPSPPLPPLQVTVPPSPQSNNHLPQTPLHWQQPVVTGWYWPNPALPAGERRCQLSYPKRSSVRSMTALLQVAARLHWKTEGRVRLGLSNTCPQTGTVRCTVSTRGQVSNKPKRLQTLAASARTSAIWARADT